METEIFTRRPCFESRLVPGNGTEIVIVQEIDRFFFLLDSYKLVSKVDDLTERFPLFLTQFVVGVNPSRSDDQNSLHIGTQLLELWHTLGYAPK